MFLDKTILLVYLLINYFLKASTYLDKNNKSSPYLNEHLINLYSEYNHFNVIIPKLKDFNYVNNLKLPWIDESTPFWLKMANQALYLDYKNYKNTKILLMKLDLAKKLPYLRKLTNICLINPWSNIKACNLKKITKNIDFLCLIDNSTPDLNFFTKNYSNYNKFCWIIYAINFLEQCQLRLIIDETQCSLNNIELIINLVLIKFNSTEKMNLLFANNFKLIYEHYASLFKERSMQILTQILILLKNRNIFNSVINEEKLLITKIHLDKLLSYLLDIYISEKLKEFPAYYLLSDYKINKQFLLTEKLKDLNDASMKFVLSRVSNIE